MNKDFVHGVIERIEEENKFLFEELREERAKVIRINKRIDINMDLIKIYSESIKEEKK